MTDNEKDSRFYALARKVSHNQGFNWTDPRTGETHAPPTIAWRIRWRVAGAHVHCRIFKAPTAASTYVNVGALTLGVDEWIAVVEMFDRVAEVLPEEPEQDI